MISKIYKTIQRFTPKGYREKIRELIRYAGLEIDYRKWAGFTALYGFGVGIAFGFIPWILDCSFLIVSLVGLGSIIGFELTSYLILVLIADRRGSFAEEVLPDALQLMSANIRAGMTPDRALLLSAREEFGPLEEEIRMAAKEAVGGKPIKEAILGISRNLKSEVLDRTVRLITEGIESGGELASLLEETSNDIRTGAMLRREVRSNVMMYVVFIFMAVGFGAPLLYAISTFLVSTMAEIGGMISLPKGGVPALPMGGTFPLMKGGMMVPKISSQFLTYFSILGLTITSIFGSLIIGLIEKGKEKEGIKYIPLLLGMTLGIFFLVKHVISSVFGAVV